MCIAIFPVRKIWLKCIEVHIGHEYLRICKINRNFRTSHIQHIRIEDPICGHIFAKRAMLHRLLDIFFFLFCFWWGLSPSVILTTPRLCEWVVCNIKQVLVNCMNAKCNVKNIYFVEIVWFGYLYGFCLRVRLHLIIQLHWLNNKTYIRKIYQYPQNSWYPSISLIEFKPFCYCWYVNTWGWRTVRLHSSQSMFVTPDTNIIT